MSGQYSHYNGLDYKRHDSVDEDLFYQRIRRGMDPELAASRPYGMRRINRKFNQADAKYLEEAT